MVLPKHSFGLGLRPDHYQSIIDTRPTVVDWFEIMTEDYLVPGGNPFHFLNKIRANYPIVMHGVSLAIGNSDPLDQAYLSALSRLIDLVQPVWVSDHLSWGGIEGKSSHDLLPLPHTPEVLSHLVDRITQVQTFLGRQILLENVSTYLRYNLPGQFTEWEFLGEVAHRADCFILLDVNNIYVNSVNHGFDPRVYIDSLPTERVRQIHLAGHCHMGTHIIDTHDDVIVDPVWSLYAYAIRRFGPVPTMIERDANIPPLAELIKELNYARAVAAEALASIENE